MPLELTRNIGRRLSRLVATFNLRSRVTIVATPHTGPSIVPSRAVLPPHVKLGYSSDNRPYKRHRPNASGSANYRAPSSEPPPSYPYPPPAVVYNAHPQHQPAHQPYGNWTPHPGYHYPPAPYAYPPQGYPTPVPPYGSQFPPAGSPPHYGPPAPNYSAHYSPQPQYQHPGVPRYPQAYPEPPSIPRHHSGSPSVGQQAAIPPAYDHAREPVAPVSSHHQAHAQGSDMPTQKIMVLEHDWDRVDMDNLEDMASSETVVPKSAPVLVSQPLSADPAADESFEPLPVAALGMEVSLSRYFGRGSLKEVTRSIRDTDHWRDMVDDPVFRDLSEPGELIPLKDIYAARAKRLHPETESSEVDVAGGPDRASSSDVERRESQEPQQSVHSVSASYLESSVPGSLSTPLTTPSVPIEAVPRKETTEEILARLGVTGSPKPVTKTALVSRPDRPFPPGSGFNSDRRRKRSISPNGYHVGHAPSPGYSHLEHPPMPRNGSMASATYETFAGRSENSDSHRDPRTHDPPSARDHEMEDTSGKADQHPAGESRRSSSERSSTAKSGQEGSQAQRRSASAEDSDEEGREKERVREHSVRKTSGGLRGERRRQVDDDTPRLKRNQPKVAEAYSRRW
ncbi:MAG: hypothetical protein M1826_000652 [Phylliscum demangeonii]|nr:MAG: hypothetical protein M1826_000652 [Phylliscum demangeonii]